MSALFKQRLRASVLEERYHSVMIRFVLNITIHVENGNACQIQGKEMAN